MQSRRVGLCFCLIGMLLSGCEPLLCDDSIKAQVSSPGNTYVATFYERNCGALTDWVQRINIQKSGQPFNGDDVVVFVGRRFPVLTMRWKDEHHLEVVCHQCGSIQNEEHNSYLTRHADTWGPVWAPVHVSYEFSNREDIPTK